MNRESAIRKILSCLRLGASANPNEAAAAIRQAKALMDKYGLTEADALTSGVKCESAKTRSRGGNLPESLLWLANVVAKAYGCRPVIHRSWSDTRIDFYGVGSAPKIAGYAFTVLRRQLERSQAQHVARVRKAANREARREAFARGWVSAVSALLPVGPPSVEHATAVALRVDSIAGATTAEARGSNGTGKSGWSDQAAGFAAGKSARLHSGLNGAGELQRISKQ